MRNQTRYIIVLVLVLFSSVAYAGYDLNDNQTDALRSAQYDSCIVLQNQQRESNFRINAHRADTDGLVKFLGDAADARDSAYERDHHIEDKQAADHYREISDMVLSKAVFHKQTVINCDDLK